MSDSHSSELDQSERFWEAEYKLQNCLRIRMSTDANPIVEVESVPNFYEPVANYVLAYVAAHDSTLQEQIMTLLKDETSEHLLKTEDNIDVFKGVDMRNRVRAELRQSINEIFGEHS